MTPTNPTDALTNGQYEVDDYGSIGEAARRICCFCEGDMRRLVYITAKEELAATEARAQGLVEALTASALRFREYEASHAAKGNLDGDAKARRNCEMAEQCEQALATWRRT